MEELILKMATCLLAALALGFLLGWFIKRAFAREHYEPRIEALELNCAQDKSLIQEKENESKKIKEQFLSTQNDLDLSSMQLSQAKEHITSYQTEITTLKEHVDERELHLQNSENKNLLLNTSLLETQKQLDTKARETTTHLAELSRVKEHHTLLYNQVNTLTQERSAKEAELSKLSSVIDGYKEDYQKLIVEQSKQNQELTTLKTTLNERNLATVDLEKNLRELHAQNHKMRLEVNASRTAITHNKKEEESFFNKLEHTVKTTPKTNIMISNTHPKTSNLMKLVKKVLGAGTKTKEHINRNADRVIQEYKNNNR